MTRDILGSITWSWRDTHLLVCGTLDGVLAENGEFPGEVRVPTSRRALLASMASLDSATVCVVSGRRLAQVQSIVSRDRRVYYVGLRGLEIEGPRLSFFHLGAARTADVLSPLAAELHEFAREIPGLSVEFRNLHLAVRLGWVHDDFIRDVAAKRILELMAPYAHTHRLRIAASGLDIEVLPDVKWTLAEAIREIKLTTERQFGKTTVVFLGNSRGDEDGFAAVRDGGLAVHVGNGQGPAAFRLRTQEEVDALLLGLVKLGHSKLSVETRIAL
jgi:trehalose 6-phosphate phosphatase